MVRSQIVDVDNHQDQIIIKQVLSGDKNVFRYFIKTYQTLVYSVVITIVKNSHDAEEVIQNTFVRAYKALHTFKGDSKFSTWLFKIAVNESLKYIRKSKKNKFQQKVNTQESDYGPSFNEAVAKLNNEDIKAQVQNILKLMKPKEALVLNFNYLHELSIKEIAQSTGFSIPNVKVLLFRARKSFMAIYLKTSIS